MNSMFKNCTSLQEIILPEFNSENEIDISYMFAGCSLLKSLNISVSKEIIASKMESMFSGCKSIQLLNLSEIKTSSVINMSHLFEGCISLTNIYLDNWNTSNVVDMNSMFAECIALEEINISHFKTSTLTDMSKMFYDCQKLKTINLSTFDMKSMKNMDELFYNCSALEILDIKNFNLINVESFKGIFTKMNKIQYIDLMNLINKKNIWESLDKNVTFYICQSRVIIENPFAFNCCEFLVNPDECNYIPSTQLMNVQTTEIPINPPIKLKIKSTNNSIIISTIKSTIIPTIKSTIIPTTNLTRIEKKEQTDLILALFSDWKQESNSCSFKSHFSSRSSSFTYSKKLNIGFKVNYKRTEEEKIGICTLQGKGMSSNAKYLCEIQIDDSNIKNIKITNFIFNPQDNINLIMTPIAKMLMNNVHDINKYNYLSGAEIYILDHCIMNIYQKKLLNIFGEIHDSQPTLKTKDIILTINLDSESDSMKELNCEFTDIKLKNYTLNCIINDGLKGDFQSAISFIDDNILIIYFDSYNESIFDNIGMQGGKIYNLNKKNQGISTGSIIAIVLTSIFLIGALIAMFKIFGKKNVKQHYREETTVVSLDIKNKI